MTAAPLRLLWVVMLPTLGGCTRLPSKDELVDPDGDGSVYGEDCDDGDGATYPGAPEVCGDEIVNDCDGDEGSAMVLCGLGGTLSLGGADLKMMGEAPGDEVGISLSGVGDVDSDGLADVLVGARFEDSGGTDAGAAYLLLGGGALARGTAPLDLSAADLKLTGEAPGDLSGTAVSGAGDVDGDGVGDLLVGATNAGAEDAGAAYILLGGALGTSDPTLDLADADMKLSGEAANDLAGFSGAGAGDVNGDSFDDLLIGAPYAGTGDAGAAYLLLGENELWADSSQPELAEAGIELAGEDDSDLAGNAVSGAGDVDGDGLNDLLVGAVGQNTNDTSAGAAYVLLGSEALAVGASSLSLTDADAKFIGQSHYDDAGTSVSGAGDVDSDGRDDLLVGARYEDSGGNDAGAAYLLLGTYRLPPLLAADLILVGEVAEDHAGWSVSGAGDVDGDGLGDLMVGAPYKDTGGADAGATYLLWGGDVATAALAEATTSLRDASATHLGEAEYDQAGWSVSGASDVDGDGFDDLLIGANYEDSGGASAGAAYLIFGGGY